MIRFEPLPFPRRGSRLEGVTMNELSAVPVTGGERRSLPPIIINTTQAAPLVWRRPAFGSGLLPRPGAGLGGPHLWRRRRHSIPHWFMLDPNRKWLLRVERHAGQGGPGLPESERRTGQVLADAAQYSNFVREHATCLEQSRQQQPATGANALRKRHGRDFPRFTPACRHSPIGIRLRHQLSTTVGSADFTVRHLGDGDVKERVAADLERMLQQHYELLVLQPEITDPACSSFIGIPWSRRGSPICGSWPPCRRTSSSLRRPPHHPSRS